MLTVRLVRERLLALLIQVITLKQNLLMNFRKIFKKTTKTLHAYAGGKGVAD